MTGDEWLGSVFQPALGRLQSDHEYIALRSQLQALYDCEVLDNRTYLAAEGQIAARQVAIGHDSTVQIQAPGTTATLPKNRLLRVIAFGEPIADINSVTVALASVEIWTNSVEVLVAGYLGETTDRLDADYHRDMAAWSKARAASPGARTTLPAPPAMAGEDLAALGINLSDNRYTRYRETSSSAAGSGTEWRLHKSFAPGLSSGADALTINVVSSGGSLLRSINLLLPPQA